MSGSAVYIGEALSRYGFGAGHPFGPDRMAAFWDRACELRLDRRVRVLEPAIADRAALCRFHDPDFVDDVRARSKFGVGFLDGGDTPAFRGIYEAAATVVGTTLDAVARVMAGEVQHAFVPIAGLHHARRDAAAGFCVFNDCGVAIETLRQVHGINRVAYVDIDAHHGDGVFYAFEDDAELVFVDLHEDGHYLYPGTGSESETGQGAASGTKLNIPMPPEADDNTFRSAWDRVESFLDGFVPEFFIFQCGADSLAGDPITHLRYSAEAHRFAAQRLVALAERHAQGRLVALGGGGYNRANLAAAWTAVVEVLISGSRDYVPGSK